MTVPQTRASASAQISTVWDESILGAFGGYSYRQGQPVEGFVPNLIAGPWALNAYELMAEEDDTVASMRWVIETTLVKAEWKHEALADGLPAANDPEAIKWAQFADSMMVDVSGGWPGHVQTALSMFWAGFSLCEIVLRQRLSEEGSQFDDAYWGFGYLSAIQQKTVTEWIRTPDRRHLVAVRQVGASAPIPLWKVLHYRTTQEEHRPAGRSLLRAAFRSYWLKMRIQDTEAIGIERELCGMPTFKVPSEELDLAKQVNPDGSQTDRAKAASARIQSAVKAVSELRFNRKGGVIVPSDVYMDADGKPTNIPKWEFKIVTTAGQRSIDPRTAIRDYDRAIARVALMQFLHLGDRSGGSYGLSNDQSSLAVQSLKALGKIIVDEYNRKALALVWQINAFPAKYRPRMAQPNISEDDLDTLGTFFARIGQASGIFDERPDLLDKVVTRAGFEGRPPGALAPGVRQQQELEAQRGSNSDPANDTQDGGA